MQAQVQQRLAAIVAAAKAGDTQTLIGVGVAVVVVLLTLSAALCSRRRPRNAPPVIDVGSIPILGTILTFMKFGENPVAFIRASYETYGPVFTLPLFGMNFTFLIGPDAEATFYGAKDDDVLSQNEPYKFMTPIFGKGIVFDAPHAVKNEQLKFIKHALRSDSFKTYVPIIAKETESFFRDPAMWGPYEGGECDLLVAMARLTINTATHCLLGEEIKKRYGGEVADLFHDIDEGITPLAIINPYLPTPAFRRRDAARAKFAKIFATIIAERRAAQKAKGSSSASSAALPEDMLQSFMEATYKVGPLKGRSLTDDQITGMLLGILFAGQHTSSITSTWTALKLLERPELFDIVMAEQRHVLGAAAYDSLSNAPLKVNPAAPGAPPVDESTLGTTLVYAMDHLHLAMREVLRMYPPLIMLMRKVLQPVTAVSSRNGGKEYDIPVGDYVFASPAVSMNIPKPDGAFEFPSRFDPYRYVDGRGEDAKKFSYSAFGGGVHACIGEQFGFIQVKTIVSILLRTYDIELLDNMPQPNYRAMVVGPTQPLRIRYRLRREPYVPRSPFQTVSAACLKGVRSSSSSSSSSAPAPAAGGGSSSKFPTVAVPVGGTSSGSSQRAPSSSSAAAAPSSSSAAVDTSLKGYTLAQVAEHNTASSAWLTVDGLVYDVTDYIVRHPGGEAALLRNIGKDATSGFNGPQHPSSVRDTIRKFVIGRLVK